MAFLVDMYRKKEKTKCFVIVVAPSLSPVVKDSDKITFF